LWLGVYAKKEWSDIFFAREQSSSGFRVQELIRNLGLDRDVALQLNPYVQEKYLKLWEAIQQDTTE
jgi:hypothetical protein